MIPENLQKHILAEAMADTVRTGRAFSESLDAILQNLRLQDPKLRQLLVDQRKAIRRAILADAKTHAGQSDD
jgi:hypothetical protein